MATFGVNNTPIDMSYYSFLLVGGPLDCVQVQLIIGTGLLSQCECCICYQGNKLNAVPCYFAVT